MKCKLRCADPHQCPSTTSLYYRTEENGPYLSFTFWLLNVVVCARTFAGFAKTLLSPMSCRNLSTKCQWAAYLRMRTTLVLRSFANQTTCYTCSQHASAFNLNAEFSFKSQRSDTSLPYAHPRTLSVTYNESSLFFAEHSLDYRRRCIFYDGGAQSRCRLISARVANVPRTCSIARTF